MRWQRLKLASYNLHGEHVDVSSVERRLQRTHLVEKHAEGPKITFEAVRFIIDNFWTKIIWRAHNGHRLINCITEHLCDTEVAKLHDSIARQENVAGLEITVQDFSVVAVFHRQTNLSKPIKNRVLREIVIAAFFFVLFYFLLEVPTICIIHNNTQLPFLRFVYFSEPNDVWVVEHFQNFRFFYGVLLLLFRHTLDIDLFDDRESAIALSLHEEGFAKGALSQHFDFLV